MSDKKDKIEEQEELNTESANVENPETEQEPELTAEDRWQKIWKGQRKNLRIPKKNTCSYWQNLIISERER